MSEPTREESSAEPLEAILADLGKVREALTRLVSLYLERARAIYHDWFVSSLAFAWCVVLVAVASLLALRQLMAGMAGGLAVLFGGRPWAGELACGLLVLGTAAAYAAAARSRRRRVRMRRLIDKYGDPAQPPKEVAHDDRERIPRTTDRSGVARAAAQPRA
ncbi:MAG TPA: hypothetical protein VJS92_04575 [Candidatus Polarisedimenticolaceae bacterium]|nr:hypothetical protein [Candidatus Polarisedimenticolaceae bacterium]